MKEFERRRKKVWWLGGSLKGGKWEADVRMVVWRVEYERRRKWSGAEGE